MSATDGKEKSGAGYFPPRTVLLAARPGYRQTSSGEVLRLLFRRIVMQQSCASDSSCSPTDALRVPRGGDRDVLPHAPIVGNSET
jgi:hypothetical protein